MATVRTASKKTEPTATATVSVIDLEKIDNLPDGLVGSKRYLVLGVTKKGHSYVGDFAKKDKAISTVGDGEIVVTGKGGVVFGTNGIMVEEEPEVEEPKVEKPKAKPKAKEPGTMSAAAAARLVAMHGKPMMIGDIVEQAAKLLSRPADEVREAIRAHVDPRHVERGWIRTGRGEYKFVKPEEK